MGTNIFGCPIMSSKDVDVYNILVYIKDRLVDIVNRYYPAPPRPYTISVPFTKDSISIRFRAPVILPFLVYPDKKHYPSSEVVEIYLYNFDLSSIFINFWREVLWSVELRSASGQIKAGDSILLSYLVFPEVHRALDEATIEFSSCDVKKWFEEFLDALDYVSRTNISDVITMKDLYNWSCYTSIFSISIVDLPKYVYDAKIDLSILRNKNDFNKIDYLKIVIEMRVQNKGVAEFMFEDIHYREKPSENLKVEVRTESDTRAKEVVSKAVEVLLMLIDSNNIFNSIERSITLFLDAYKKVLTAYKFMNI